MKRPIILTSIIILAVFLLGYFVLLEKYNDLRSFRFQIEQKKLDLEDLRESFTSLSNLDEELKEYESEISRISSALPADADIPSVANFIQEISKENELTIESLEFGQDVSSRSSRSSTKTVQAIEGASDIKENNFSLSLFGSYSDFKNFLSSLEKSVRIIGIKEMTFSSLTGSLNFTFDLELKVYSY